MDSSSASFSEGIFVGEKKQGYSSQFDVRALVAFDRVHLNPGETKVSTLHVPSHAFKYWLTDAGRWFARRGREGRM